MRLHGLASSPTPETQVLVAWAWAGADAKNGAKNPKNKASKAMRCMIYLLVSAEILSAMPKNDDGRIASQAGHVPGINT